MIVVFFTPSDADPTSGPITETMRASADVIADQGRPFAEVEVWSDRYDSTHEVVAGVLTPKSGG